MVTRHHCKSPKHFGVVSDLSSTVTRISCGGVTIGSRRPAKSVRFTRTSPDFATRPRLGKLSAADPYPRSTRRRGDGAEDPGPADPSTIPGRSNGFRIRGGVDRWYVGHSTRLNRRRWLRGPADGHPIPVGIHTLPGPIRTSRIPLPCTGGGGVTVSTTPIATSGSVFSVAG